jgi:hypothetical protein
MPANCSRVLLNRVAQTRAGREALDVGIYQNKHWKVKVKTVRHARTAGRASRARLIEPLRLAERPSTPLGSRPSRLAHVPPFAGVRCANASGA